MSHVTKSIVVLLCLSLGVTACSKKKSRGDSPPTGAAAPAPVPDDEYDPRAPLPDDEYEEGRQGQPRTGRSEEYYEREERYGQETRRPARPPRAPEVDVDEDEEFDTRGRVGETRVGRGSQCGESFGKNSELWYPGLPYQPSRSRYCTGMALPNLNKDEVLRCDQTNKAVFTDSRPDELMAFVVDRVHQMPPRLQVNSRAFAQRIAGLKVHADIDRGGLVKVQLVLHAGNRQFQKIPLVGEMRSWRGAQRGDVVLKGRGFSGLLTCADADRGCQNSIVRIEQLGRTGKAVAIAYVIHRWGDAHVTVSDQDLRGARSISNPGHRAFAEFLSNTVHNSCLATLADVRARRVQMPECAQRRLLALCGRDRYRANAASSLNFRSWAVAYGPSGFEFSMRGKGQRGLYDYDIPMEPAFNVQGPLIASHQNPAWPRKLRAKGQLARYVDGVVLVANDGAGNLNLQVDFTGGGQRAYSRISITTLMDGALNSGRRLVENAREMPALPPERLSDRDEDVGRAPVEQPRAPVEQGGFDEPDDGEFVK